VRTTLTLDPDVAAALREAQRRTGAQQKALVNDALRRGLHDLVSERQSPRKPYVTESVDPGEPALTGIHSVYDLLAFAEGEDFR
jgi:hypothetical protein